MTKYLIKIFLILHFFSVGVVFSVEVPEKYWGAWEFQVDTSPAFPWWNQIKYPVKLIVTKNAVKFEDQAGFNCEPKAFFYDDELDALIFKHCLPTKSELAFSPFYRVMLDDQKLNGEVWTYKLLFNLRGGVMQDK